MEAIHVKGSAVLRQYCYSRDCREYRPLPWYSGITTDSEIAQWELPKDLKDLKQRVEEEEEKTKRRIEAGEQPEGYVLPRSDKFCIMLIFWVLSGMSKGSKIDRKTTLKHSRDTTRTAQHLENVRHPPRSPILNRLTTL